jgi:lysozyme family protein
MFDIGVNCGVRRAALWLQKSINILAGSKIAEDCTISDLTIEALNNLKHHH